ncbi:MAG: hypothetical protein N3D11_07485 [Candidatus Sumerlaeia bacterium]|nr:hypothetical protein [Candidatus Sumerlaeia bacterium]
MNATDSKKAQPADFFTAFSPLSSDGTMHHVEGICSDGDEQEDGFGDKVHRLAMTGKELSSRRRA